LQPLPSMTVVSGRSVTSGEYGEGAKWSNLFYMSLVTVDCCFGFVGAGARRFCLESLADGGSTCGVAKHSSKFQPILNQDYLQGVDSMAFCTLCFVESLVPSSTTRVSRQLPRPWKNGRPFLPVIRRSRQKKPKKEIFSFMIGCL
jgi:hypothetical protein